MNKVNERKVGAGLSYVSIALNTIITLLYTPFMLKMIGQSEYGLYSLVSSILGYLTVLDLGFGNAIIVYTAKYRQQEKYEEEKKLHGMFFLIFIIIGIIAAIISLFLYFNVDNMFGSTMTILELKKAKTMMLILTLNLLFTFPLSVFSSIITAYEKFVFQKLISIARTILNPLIMVPLLFLGSKSITMILVISILNLSSLVINYFYCRKKLKIEVRYKGFDKKLFKEIFGYSFFIFLNIIVDKVNWSVDQFILGAVSGTFAVSVYTIATHFNSLFINLSTAFSGVFLPKISKMVANSATDEEMTKEFIKVGRVQYLVILLAVTGLILFGKEFIISWVGLKYTDSYYIAIILIIPVCISLIQNLGISILQAKNLHKFRSILYILMALVNIIISYPLGKVYGGVGCAIGTAISLILGNILIMNIYYYKKAGINIIKFWKEILKMSLPVILPIIIIIGIMNVIHITGFLNLLVFGSIYVFMYLIVIYKMSMNEYEKEIVNNIYKFIKTFFNKKRKVL